MTAPRWAEHFVATVRANDRYEFVPIEELPDTARRSLESVNGAHGVLVSRASSELSDIVVDAAGAGLVKLLSNGGPPPATLAEEPAALAQLVLDEVLQIETSGGYTSGPDAFVDLVAEPIDPPVSALACRSHDLIRRAARIGTDSRDLIMARLYRSGRLPVSARWERIFPSPDAVASMLGYADMVSPLHRDWFLTTTYSASGWLAWSRHDDRQDSPPSEFPYKLYVSPLPGALPELARSLVSAITDAGSSRFKIGSDAPGLLRPDKFVVYASNAAEVTTIAAAVTAAIGPAEAHGVPFTAELANGGLQSWAGDPASDQSPVGLGAESWRVAVCRRAADWIAQAQRARLDERDVTKYALARLDLAGVDIASFSPKQLTAPASPPASEPLVPT